MDLFPLEAINSSYLQNVESAAVYSLSHVPPVYSYFFMSDMDAYVKTDVCKRAPAFRDGCLVSQIHSNVVT